MKIISSVGCTIRISEEVIKDRYDVDKNGIYDTIYAHGGRLLDASNEKNISYTYYKIVKKTIKVLDVQFLYTRGAKQPSLSYAEACKTAIEYNKMIAEYMNKHVKNIYNELEKQPINSASEFFDINQTTNDNRSSISEDPGDL